MVALVVVVMMMDYGRKLWENVGWASIGSEADGRIVLGVRQPGGGWALPSEPVDEAAQGAPADLGLQYLDCGNVIGALQVRPSDAIARPRWRDGPVRSRQAHV